jgi:hypothetical protein
LNSKGAMNLCPSHQRRRVHNLDAENSLSAVAAVHTRRKGCQRTDAGTPPLGVKRAQRFSRAIRYALIHMAYTLAGQSQQHAPTTLSPTRETWFSSGIQRTTGEDSVRHVIQSRLVARTAVLAAQVICNQGGRGTTFLQRPSPTDRCQQLTRACVPQ